MSIPNSQEILYHNQFRYNFSGIIFSEEAVSGVALPSFVYAEDILIAGTDLEAQFIRYSIKQVFENPAELNYYEG